MAKKNVKNLQHFTAATLKEKDRKNKKAKKPSTYFIDERNLLKWLMVILTPFLIAVIVALGDRNFAIWLPSFSMYQCGHW